LIKNVLLTLLQFVLFLIAFAAGSLLPLTGVSFLTKWADGTRGFQWDGVLLMLALFVLILLIEAARKRLRLAASWTTLALVLAAVAGLVMKFGFMTFDR
jgi:hypothetical protein